MSTSRPGPSRFTPTDLSATATWAMCAQACTRAAEILGRPDDTRRYRRLFEKIKRAFLGRFYDREAHAFRHTGSPQCANAMALCADLAPDEDRPRLVQQIIDDLRRRHWQQTPGDIGHVYFIRALAAAGRSDVLHRAYHRTSKGSYGGILKKGLTSMPETWDAIMDGYQSLNHCMLGHVMEWFYGYVAGIRQAPGSVGWQRVVIGPNPGPLTWAEGTVGTPRGLITSHWEHRNGRFRLRAVIPPGIQATARLPSGIERSLSAGTNTWEAPLP